jgi:hypothetical protein
MEIKSKVRPRFDRPNSAVIRHHHLSSFNSHLRSTILPDRLGTHNHHASPHPRPPTLPCLSTPSSNPSDIGTHADVNYHTIAFQQRKDDALPARGIGSCQDLGGAVSFWKG